MSADIKEKSWVELCEEDLSFDKAVNDHESNEDKLEDNQKCDDISDDETLVDDVSFTNKSGLVDSPIEDNSHAVLVKEEDSNTAVLGKTESEVGTHSYNIADKVISKFIKIEKDDVSSSKTKEENEKVINTFIKVEKDDQSQQDENHSDNDDVDDMYLFMNHSEEVDATASNLQETKVKTKPKTEPVVELKLEGAEDDWGMLTEPQEEQSASKQLTFAQICAKNSSPASVAQVCVDNSSVSPGKKQRKRSLFPEHSDSKKEVFGFLDENSAESPSKDIRKIMTNIHMDSPLRNSSENFEAANHRKIAVAKRSNLMDSLDSSNSSNLRKRCRDPSKSSGSPAPKMPHYSDNPKASKDSPARKARPLETDKGTLTRRQKQIDYGKNTKGYDNYIKMVPKDKREAHHPKTPPKHIMYSRRAWDGLIKVWRQKLHFWDLPSEGGQGGIGLPDSWDSLSETSFSISNSDEMSEKSLPTTPQADRKRVRQGSNVSLDTVSNSGD